MLTVSETPCRPVRPLLRYHGNRISRKYRTCAQKKQIRRREYKRLKAIVPAVSSKDKVPKVTVIEAAIKYIDELHLALASRMNLIRRWAPTASANSRVSQPATRPNPHPSAAPYSLTTPGTQPHPQVIHPASHTSPLDVSSQLTKYWQSQIHSRMAPSPCKVAPGEMRTAPSGPSLTPAVLFQLLAANAVRRSDNTHATQFMKSGSKPDH